MSTNVASRATEGSEAHAGPVRNARMKKKAAKKTAKKGKN
jgi:hypothetical protein